jgi:PIN domain nuclease of toxin-antitoxin system
VLQAAVRRTERVALSAFSLVEIAILHGQGKLRLKASLNEFFNEMQVSPTFNVLPVTYEIAADAGSLHGLRDPADRAIVATARVHRLRLMTSDQRIIESKLVPVVA